jgi:hypothetical protein
LKEELGSLFLQQKESLISDHHTS